MSIKNPFVQNFLGTILGGITLFYLYQILPESPGGMMFFLYSVIIPLVSIAFGIALVVALCWVLWGVWKLLTDRGHQRNAWEKVRQWPTGKRDAIVAMALSWTAAIYALLLALIFTLPRGRFTEQELNGTALAILLLAVTPISILVYWHFGKFAIDVWQTWKSETGMRRFWIGFGVIAFIFVFALMAWGDIFGWDEIAWFAR